MTKVRYAKQRGGVGFYSEIELESLKTEELESFVSDHCSWNMIKSENPTYIIGSGYDDWKEAGIKGIKFALSRINHREKKEIKFLDLNGHPAHSNLYSMFAAGFLCLFEDFGIELKKEDYENLLDFVSSSAGWEKINEMPNEKKLAITMYNKS